MPEENPREKGTELNLDFSKIKDPKSGKGLVPVIVQHYETKDVLMVAYTDEGGFKMMLQTRKAAFWSRSRQKSWIKGEESGNFMDIVHMYIDCDQDTILVLVAPKGEGKACHTKDKKGQLRRTCFYRLVLEVDEGRWKLVLRNNTGDSSE